MTPEGALPSMAVLTEKGFGALCLANKSVLLIQASKNLKADIIILANTHQTVAR